MILQALTQLYERLLQEEDSGVAPPGYSYAPVTHALELGKDGRLVAVHPLYALKGKRMESREMLLPERVGRTVGVSANFLADHAGYVLGQDNKGKPERSLETHAAFYALHETLLAESEDPAAQALLLFLRNWQPTDVNEARFDAERDVLLSGGNIVFLYEEQYVHERPALRVAWMRFKNGEQEDVQLAQCLVTGQIAPIAKIHPAIKGVVGAQSTGAALVSFNQKAFTFFGKEQSLNAPVSEPAAFAYTTVLNHMTAKRNAQDRRCLRIGDTTQVFWAETKAPLEEFLFAELMDPQPETRGDPQGEQLMRDALMRLRDGKPLAEMHIDEHVCLHLLGLAPNAARISVRYYHVNDFGTLARAVAQHHQDTDIVHGPNEPAYLPPWRILLETAAQGKGENIPFGLSGALMQAIYSGDPYPWSLYTALLTRIRADKQINRPRVGMIKGCLLRNARRLQDSTKEEAITLALNGTWQEPGYLMGRLFALLEKTQVDALGRGINATIKDRYFGAASATPAKVFPQLLRMAQHHLSKVGYMNRQIQELLYQIDVEEKNPLGFPATLTLEQQGLFMLGYYHQRQAPWAAKREGDGAEVVQESTHQDTNEE